MRSQRATADVRIVTSSDALEEETPPFETQMPPPNPACHAANLLGHFGSVARVPTSPSSSYLPPHLQKSSVSFHFNCTTILFLFHCISYNVYLPKPILPDPLLRRPGSPRTDPSCLIAYRGSSLRPVQLVCAVALSGAAGRYIARRYTAIVVTRSVTLL
jgi:hypothetical protein